MLKELDAVIEQFLRESYSDFAELDMWFREVIEKYHVRQDGYDKQFVATLAYAGWFIFASRELMPKLHQGRCFVELDDWNPVAWLGSIEPSSTKSRNASFGDGHIVYGPFVKQLKAIFKEERRFTFSCNTDFRLAVDKTSRFHGNSWISPRLVVVLMELHERPAEINGTQVQTLSWELRDEADVLVAADIGYRVGQTYSSMSGFSDRRYPSAGILQLVAEAMTLQDTGFKLWDLGEHATYKMDLGAKCLAPETYLTMLRRHRTQDRCQAASARSLSEINGFIQMHDHLF